MSSSELAIAIRGLSKSYTIDHNADGDDPATLAESMLRRVGGVFRRPRRETFWALRDVSFELRKGEVLGIIGRNGAGKSTLLKILSRITGPTTGRVELYGRVGSLLEVGTGFHRELTGRENIYLNGAILGMSRREIARQFDAIVDFSGTQKFLDTPVKRYSSGMYVRLAFAVAAHLNPEILIVDEVLAVGDADFQKKCLGKMSEVSRQGRTVLFVSHNMTTIQSLCGSCVWLDGGQVRMHGPTDEVLGQYLGGTVTSSPEVDLQDHPGRPRGGGDVILKHLRLLDGAGRPGAAISIGQSLRVQLLLDPRQTLHQPMIGIGVSTHMGQRVLTVHTRYARSQLDNISGPTWIECELPSLPLMPGTYSLKVAVGVAGRDVIDQVENAATFEVLPHDVFGTGAIPHPTQGFVVQASAWRVVGSPAFVRQAI